MTKRKAALLASVLLVPWMAREGSATTLRPMSLAEIADQAEVVFTGGAVRSEVVLSKDGTYPFTFVTFHVDEVLKGEVEGDELTLRFDGGQLGQEAVFVDGMPQFDEGETYLLFVAENGRLASPVVGWRQGQLRFVLDGDDLKLVDSAGRRVRGIAGGRWQLDATESQSASLQGPQAKLLSQEGVEITPVRAEAAAAAKASVVGAENVLDQLRSFLLSRSQEKGLVPPRPVRSADPAEVPESARFRAMAVRKAPRSHAN